MPTCAGWMLTGQGAHTDGPSADRGNAVVPECSEFGPAAARDLYPAVVAGALLRSRGQGGGRCHAAADDGAGTAVAAGTRGLPVARCLWRGLRRDRGDAGTRGPRLPEPGEPGADARSRGTVALCVQRGGRSAHRRGVLPGLAQWRSAGAAGPADRRRGGLLRMAAGTCRPRLHPWWGTRPRWRAMPNWRRSWPASRRP